MQAVILLAGVSSRFYPFNSAHKSFVKIAGKPLIEHTLNSVKKSGLKEAIVVVKDDSARKFIENINPSLKLKFVIQKEATGMGEALLLAEKYIKEDFFLLHGHRLDFEILKKEIEKKKIRADEIVLIAKKIQDRETLKKIGVLSVKGDKVLEIVEKPQKNIPSDLGVVGVYFLNRNFLTVLSNTPKGHYNFEEAVSLYAKKHGVKFVLSKEDNISFKYPWDILLLKNYLLSNLNFYISKKAKVSSSAIIKGQVHIEDGVQILENAVIKGPCFIGKNSYIGNNAVLRNGCDIEENCVVGANMEVKNTLIMENSKTHSGFLGDSVIGKNCRIGAGFVSANVRIDRSTVKTVVDGKKLDTGFKSLGIMVGDGTKIGIKSSSMPGTIIGKEVIVGPSTNIMNNVGDSTKYYTKFSEIVIRKNERIR